ncbi:TAAR1 protein, partial [Polypterus senegalus]|nr:TAAR1 protein [Polypterus senegalus]
MLSTASILHLSFISIDRYYAVCHPLSYQTKITVFVTLNMILISWILSAMVGFGMIFLGLNIKGIEDFYYKNLDCVGSCTLIQSEASSMVSSLLSFYIPGLVMIGIYIKIFKVAKRQARSIRDLSEQRATATEKKNMASSKPFSTPPSLVDALVWFGYLNSTFNPLVYGFFYSWFRKALKIIAYGKIFQNDSSRTRLFIE